MNKITRINTALKPAKVSFFCSGGHCCVYKIAKLKIDILEGKEPLIWPTVQSR